MANDSWRTPPEVINFIEHKLGEKIQLDLCSSDENRVCDFNINEIDNFLDDRHLDEPAVDLGELCWMNPPYSNPLPFVKQAIKWSQHGYAVAGILNYDGSTKWFIEIQKHAAILMPVIGGRIAFIGPLGLPIKGNNKPQIMFYLSPFGSKIQKTDYIHIDEIYKPDW